MEERQRLQANCFGNSFEELFSFLFFKEKEKGREPPFIFSCNGLLKLIIKSLGSSFQKIKFFKQPFIFECKVFKIEILNLSGNLFRR